MKSSSLPSAPTHAASSLRTSAIVAWTSLLTGAAPAAIAAFATAAYFVSTAARSASPHEAFESASIAAARSRNEPRIVSTSPCRFARMPSMVE